MKKNKNFFLIIFIIVIILIVITTVSFTLSYGYFKKDVVSANQLFKSGKFEITYSMGSAVTLDNTYPMSDRAGNATEANTITINNTGDYYACYALTLTDSTSALNKSQMRYSINKAARDYDYNDNKTLILGGIPSKEQVKLDFRTWIKDTETEETATNLEYSGNLQVESVSCNNTLGNEIFEDNKIITAEPTLDLPATDTNENGLYKIATDDGTTYVFRGVVENNYVSFAGKTWRIIRVNEDGTIRMILTESLGNFSLNVEPSPKNIKYNNSSLKKETESLFDDEFASPPEIAYSTFCDDFNLAPNDNWNYKSSAEHLGGDGYVPTLSCKKPLALKVGLISLNEVIFSGNNVQSDSCHDCYLFLENNKEIDIMTMSSGGYHGYISKYLSESENIYWTLANLPVEIYNEEYGSYIDAKREGTGEIHPVISLNANVEVTGNGTKNNPYVVK